MFASVTNYESELN